MHKPIITIIVAMNKDRVIGLNNKLPWHITEDLQYFKKVTMGKPIVMGRKTFESIGMVLPGRKNIVISRNSNYSHSSIVTYTSLLDAINDNKIHDEICIIGGGEIFTQAVQIADIIHTTTVDLHVDGDVTLFPDINLKEWKTYSSRDIVAKNGVKCAFNVMFRYTGNIDADEYCSKLACCINMDK